MADSARLIPCRHRRNRSITSLFFMGLEVAIHSIRKEHAHSIAVGCVGMILLFSNAAHAVVGMTPWGPFDFPPPVRSQREAQSMHDEARAPIVVAIRFLAATDRGDAPWINRHLACGTNDTVRTDLAQAMVRASTLLAHSLTTDLERGRQAAAELRSGRVPDRPVRYGGPVSIVLEPVRISAAGEALPPTVVVEPHLRVFVSASVPRCARNATGAFGSAGVVHGGYLVTASPALELGWPTYSPNVLGQRVVMATDNQLTDGFCCGQENSFGLDSLISIYDFRDYQTKSRLRNTLETLATAKRRDPSWFRKVRDAFGLPERYSEINVGSLAYGSGRIASGEFVIWPTKPEAIAALKPEAAAPSQQVGMSLADVILGLAWYAHSRAELISPALLETYDPERKYSFVGWPEEFRDELSAEPNEQADEAAAALPTGGVLEVFGAERRFSFVGEPDAIAENIAFAIAAWKAETELLDRTVTQPFLALYATGSSREQAVATITRGEADATARNRLQQLQSVLAGAVSGTPALDSYISALSVLDGRLPLPGLTGSRLDPESARTAASASSQRYTLRWAGNSVAVPAGSAEELRLSLRRLYRDTFREELGGLEQIP